MHRKGSHDVRIPVYSQVAQILHSIRPTAEVVKPRATSWRRPTLEMLEARQMLTFLAPTTLPAGASPAGIAVGDYNSDGKADMAVVDQTSANINLLLSNLAGTGVLMPMS
jgi:hypothetical protein